MKALIIIPAYNEAESLKGVIERLRSTCPQYDYIIVNDGSTDGTMELCEENNYNIINHTANEGLSGAIHTGCTVVNDRLHFSQKNMMKTTLSKTLDVWRSRRRRETSKVGAGYITPR